MCLCAWARVQVSLTHTAELARAITRFTDVDRNDAFCSLFWGWFRRREIYCARIRYLCAIVRVISSNTWLVSMSDNNAAAVDDVTSSTFICFYAKSLAAAAGDDSSSSSHFSDECVLKLFFRISLGNISCFLSVCGCHHTAHSIASEMSPVLQRKTCSFSFM